MTSEQMRAEFGDGPHGRRCEDCAYLQPTVTRPRPDAHARTPALTTFVCAAARHPVGPRPSWSVAFLTCGLFRQA